MKLEDYQNKFKELKDIEFEELEIPKGETLEKFLKQHKIDDDYEITLCHIFKKDIKRFDYFYNVYVKDCQRKIYRTLNDDTKLHQQVFGVPHVYVREEDKFYRIPNSILHNDVESDLIIEKIEENWLN
ncbi:hypothetical protein BPT24_211 [Tenacibaculum phage pT24]|uniref:Uncharacterized protein n=1 Tax=Tenacibaculum phage pT24 TaxID=1880590 RepID=A0A1B4XX03_9CAUD|nr:hypothetical protein HYP10_gp211 [Tenacibaculum phage pT24]BAV39335.1 hypothetical protein BPT24_211 [Tenacibaculum phage pT24]